MGRRKGGSYFDLPVRIASVGPCCFLQRLGTLQEEPCHFDTHLPGNAVFVIPSTEGRVFTDKGIYSPRMVETFLWGGIVRSPASIVLTAYTGIHILSFIMHKTKYLV